MENKKLLVIIPAYNEEGAIANVIANIKRCLPSADILVVNDCSTDRTGEIVASIPEANLINLPINLGIGGAMQTGYIYAYENGYDYAMQTDGDGQHDPAEATKLIKEISKNKADMVIGSRFLEKTGYKQSVLRRFGINIFEFLIKILIHQKITDSTSGFRIANKKVIKKFAEYYPTDYPEVEVLVYLDNAGLKFTEVPVKMARREHGKSSITPFKSAYYMVKVIYSLLISKIRGI